MFDDLARKYVVRKATYRSSPVSYNVPAKDSSSDPT